MTSNVLSSNQDSVRDKHIDLQITTNTDVPKKKRHFQKLEGIGISSCDSGQFDKIIKSMQQPMEILNQMMTIDEPPTDKPCPMKSLSLY